MLNSSSSNGSLGIWFAVAASVLVGTGVLQPNVHQGVTVAPPAGPGFSIGPPYSSLSTPTYPLANTSFGCAGLSNGVRSNASQGTALISSHASSASCSAVQDNQAALLPFAVFQLPINGSIGAMQARVQFTVAFQANWSVSLGTCNINTTSGQCSADAYFDEYAEIGLDIVGKNAPVVRSTVWYGAPINGTGWTYSCVSGNCTTNTSLANLTGSTHGSSSVTLFLRHQLQSGVTYELTIAIGASVRTLVYSTGTFVGTSAGVALTQTVSVTKITVK